MIILSFCLWLLQPKSLIIPLLTGIIEGVLANLKVQTSKICNFRLLRKRWGFTHRSEGGTWQGSSSSGSRHLHSLTDHDPNVWTQKVRCFLKGKNQLETKSSHKSVPRTQPLAESVAEIAPAEGAHPMQHLGRPCATHPTHGSKLFDLRKMKLEIPCKNSKHEFLINYSNDILYSQGAFTFLGTPNGMIHPHICACLWSQSLQAFFLQENDPRLSSNARWTKPFRLPGAQMSFHLKETPIKRNQDSGASDVGKPACKLHKSHSPSPRQNSETNYKLLKCLKLPLS